MSLRLTRGVTLRFISATGRGLPRQAGWPFARLEIVGSEMTAKLFRTTLTIPSAIPARVRENRTEFGQAGSWTVIRFDLTPPQAGVATVELVFSDRSRIQDTVAALRNAGFDVQDTT